MDVFFIRALQLILCFSILIVLHEGGHFLAAKIFKIRVEKFCLFFDPWFKIAKYRPLKSETTYVLGWLPLGGYVKISGMIDESMDKEQLKSKPQPWEFRSKPAWQRLIVMLAGIFVNFMLALFIYSMILFTWGDTYIPIKEYTYGFKFNSTALDYGFKDGDIPLQADNKIFDRFDSNESIGYIYRTISTAKKVKVIRNGKVIILHLPGNLNLLKMMQQNPPFMLPLQPSVVDSVIPNSAASKVHIRKGDKILSFNGEKISTSNNWVDIRKKMDRILLKGKSTDSLKLRNISITVMKLNGQIDTFNLTLNKQFQMGIIWKNPLKKYKKKKIHYTFLSSFPVGFSHGLRVLKGYVSDLKYLFTKDGVRSVGSFASIGALFPTIWNWKIFWNLTAFISLMLAFMNLLPIPALDGGHALFLIYEVIVGKKPGDKFLERAQIIGMIILFLLMGYAVFNDILKFVL